MVDVNEEIVREYFEIVENCLVRNNIEYDNYYADIDLIAINKAGQVFDVEVKWKSRITIDDSDNKQNGFGHFVKQLKNPERNKAIVRLTGKKPAKKIFVTTKHFFTKTKKDYWVKRFKQENIEVLFFDDIISKLIRKVDVKGKYESPVLQTVRMLKYFNKLS